MKNRKTIIVAFLLVAALCIGIGYAALSDTLKVSGTANLDASAAVNVFDDDVYFSAVTSQELCTAHIVRLNTIDTNATDTSDADGKCDGATITIDNTLGVQFDVAKATFTVTNDANSPVTVRVTPATSNNSVLKVNTDQTSYTIDGGKTANITVIVTLQETITSDVSNETFVLLLDVSSAG